MMTTAGSAYTKNQQLKATLLLVIACCVMLICLTQRASILHQMQVKAAEISLATQNSGHEATTPSLSPCELSAHSLLAAQPLHFDTIILAGYPACCAGHRERPRPAGCDPAPSAITNTP
ncbi:hypothetical protein HIJ99_20730 [Cronobacter sakazakii]|nr:hypothetical protein [Cronobacter sakazakii]